MLTTVLHIIPRIPFVLACFFCSSGILKIHILTGILELWLHAFVRNTNSGRVIENIKLDFIEFDKLVYLCNQIKLLIQGDH